MLTSSDPTPHGLRAWENCEPWLVYTVVNFLDGYLEKDMRVFEWGCGGSTIWYSTRVKEVISVDHDPVWLDKVNKRIEEKGITNSKRYLVKKEQCFSNYANFAHSVEGLFDLVVVDGRGRVRCMEAGKDIVKPGGYLVLDNSDRSYYADGINFLSDWESDYHYDRWGTTIFKKPIGK